MADLLFSFADAQGRPTNDANTPDPLTITTGANQIEWSYGLNTQTYPTYGGEVVQILSAYIDDLTVTGQVANYETLDRIYKFFLSFLYSATQPGGFAEYTIQMQYPERGWSLIIIPKALPGLQYGRDVIAPQWQLQAAVIEPDLDQLNVTADVVGQFGLDTFGKLTADIGFKDQDPFQGQLPNDPKFNPNQTLSQIGNSYDKIVQAYVGGDFSSLTANYGSLPAFLARNNPTQSGTGAKDALSKIKSQGPANFQTDTGGTTAP